MCTRSANYRRRPPGHGEVGQKYKNITFTLCGTVWTLINRGNGAVQPRDEHQVLHFSPLPYVFIFIQCRTKPVLSPQFAVGSKTIAKRSTSGFAYHPTKFCDVLRGMQESQLQKYLDVTTFSNPSLSVLQSTFVGTHATRPTRPRPSTTACTRLYGLFLCRMRKDGQGQKRRGCGTFSSALVSARACIHYQRCIRGLTCEQLCVSCLWMSSRLSSTAPFGRKPSSTSCGTIWSYLQAEPTPSRFCTLECIQKAALGTSAERITIEQEVSRFGKAPQCVGKSTSTTPTCVNLVLAKGREGTKLGRAMLLSTYLSWQCNEGHSRKSLAWRLLQSRCYSHQPNAHRVAKVRHGGNVVLGRGRQQENGPTQLLNLSLISGDVMHHGTPLSVRLSYGALGKSSSYGLKSSGEWDRVKPSRRPSSQAAQPFWFCYVRPAELCSLGGYAGSCLHQRKLCARYGYGRQDWHQFKGDELERRWNGSCGQAASSESGTRHCESSAVAHKCKHAIDSLWRCCDGTTQGCGARIQPSISAKRSDYWHAAQAAFTKERATTSLWPKKSARTSCAAYPTRPLLATVFSKMWSWSLFKSTCQGTKMCTKLSPVCGAACTNWSPSSTTPCSSKICGIQQRISQCD